VNKKERRSLKKRTIWIKFKTKETGKLIVSVRLKRSEWKAINRIARELNMAVDELIDQALRSYLEGFLDAIQR
jgi:predicted DNA-binding ribbon-helix-helix protein